MRWRVEGEPARAVSKASITKLQALAERDDCPMHIHIAEQTGDVDQCISVHNMRPVERLLQVMKFGNRSVTTDQHLAVNLSRDRREPVSIDDACELVHAATPGPEVILVVRPSPLGVPRERPLECMAVRIRHAGYYDAGDPIVRMCAGTQVNLADPPGLDRQPDVFGPTVVQQHFSGIYRGHRSIRSRLYIQASTC